MQRHRRPLAADNQLVQSMVDSNEKKTFGLTGAEVPSSTSRMGFPRLEERVGSCRYRDTLDRESESSHRRDLQLNMENIYFSGSPCTTNHMNPVVRLKPLSPDTILRKSLKLSVPSSTADSPTPASSSAELAVDPPKMIVRQPAVVKQGAIPEKSSLTFQNIPLVLSPPEPAYGDVIIPTESDFAAFMLDKFEYDIIDTKYDWATYDVNWERHFLVSKIRGPVKTSGKHVPEEELESETLEKARELAINFFKMEEENPTLYGVTKDDLSKLAALTPAVEMEIKDDILDFVDRRCIEANRKFGRYSYVVLNKFYHCERCKNNCFITPDLMNHIKYCSQYIHRNYNHTKRRAVEMGKSRENPSYDPKLKMKPIVSLKKDYECPGCKRLFPIGSKILAKHLKAGKKATCRRSETYDCDRCKITFTSFNSFWNHVYALHDGIPRYKCNFCVQTFPTVERKQEHIAFHHLAVVPNYPMFKCNKCNKRFRSLLERKRHDNTHVEFRYCCTRCDKNFTVAYYFRAHCLKEHESVEVRCCCCTEVYEDLISYQVHYRTAHCSVEVIPCEICQQFFSRSDYIRHKKICCDKKSFAKPLPKCPPKPRSQAETSYADIDYRCAKCNEIFKDGLLFRSHCLKEHETMEVGCIKCPNVFQNMMKYHLHYQEIHRPQEMKQCKSCQQKLSLAKYADHVKTCLLRKTYSEPDPKHCPTSTKKPDYIGYSCPKCGMFYRNCFSFTAHALTAHKSTEVQCVKCFEVFESLFEYHQHYYSTHENRSNVQCYTCRRSYTSAGYVEHVKTCQGTESETKPQPNLTSETNGSPGTSSFPIAASLKPDGSHSKTFQSTPAISPKVTVQQKSRPAILRKSTNGMSSSALTLYRPRGNSLRSKSPEVIVLD